MGHRIPLIKNRTKKEAGPEGSGPEGSGPEGSGPEGAGPEKTAAVASKRSTKSERDNPTAAATKSSGDPPDELDEEIEL